MTDLLADTRVIEPEAPQYNATLVRREDETESLAYFWVRFDGDPSPFESFSFAYGGSATVPVRSTASTGR